MSSDPDADAAPDASEPWDVEPLDEPEPYPTAEESEMERKMDEALQAVRNREKLNVFQRFAIDMKRQHALELWVPPPEKGSGRQIRSTIDGGTGLFIASLLATKKWPWRNEGDFVRSAIKYLIVHHRLGDDSAYKGYFKLQWDIHRRAQLILQLKDVSQTVRQIEGAVKAHLDVDNDLDAAGEYLKREVMELRAQNDDWSHMVLKKLEGVMTQGGGPAMLAVWRRV